MLFLGTDVIEMVQQNFCAEQFELQAHRLLGDIIDSGIDMIDTTSTSNKMDKVRH